MVAENGGVSLVRIDHIVWDWNGTLFDDGDALVLATIDAFAVTGIAEVTRNHYRAHFTRPIPDFYDRLAGRTLTRDEQIQLDKQFQISYARRIAEEVTVQRDAVSALSLWRDAGRTQSLLSMYPHERLLELRQLREIGHFFVRVDGTAADESSRKEPHLRRHLATSGIDPQRALVIGDNIDDVDAARACGLRCVLYHPGERALLSHTRIRELEVPVAGDLPGAVRWALAPDDVIGPA
jgi:phosphoglycolate phosphatase-like HAD superfamily hydrolase